MNVPESPTGRELSGEPVDEAEQARNRNTVARWAKA
jgi:hypothetical protein